jgi:hypothetical protein
MMSANRENWENDRGAVDRRRAKPGQTLRLPSYQRGTLRANNWQPDWGYNDNFRDKSPAETYERAYQNQLPLFNGSAHAVLGGWHMAWPEGDWNELADKRLIVWTFAESEPWVEVWEDESRFRVIQRIT